jgi:hypothetical protein
MMKKKLVVDWRNIEETMVYQQLSSYFCIKTKSKEKLYPFLFQLARLTANVILCTCIYFNRLVGMMWLCEDITTIIIIIYLFFPSLSLVSTASLRFFCVHRQRHYCKAMMYRERIYSRIGEKCVPSVRLYVTQGFTLCIHPRK